MSITLNISQELEKKLSEGAAQVGLSLSEYVIRILSNALTIGNKPKNGAELVEYWQTEGLIGARPDII